MQNVTIDNTIPAFNWDRGTEIYRPLRISYPAGELVYKTGSYAAGVYLISGGLVSDHCPVENGETKKLPIEILGPGDLIGLEIFLEDQNGVHLSCAHAVTDTVLRFFQRETFLKMLQAEQEMTRYCLKYLSRRFYYLKQWRSAFFNLPLETRLARVLLTLVEKCADGQQEAVALPPEITKAMLSQLLGVSTAKVSKALASLPEISLHKQGILVSSAPLQLRLASASSRL